MVGRVLLGLMLCLPSAEPPAPRPHPAVGINLNAPNARSTELPFVDVFRLSRPWISQKRGAGWGKGPALDLDAHGWIRRLEPGCSAETVLCAIPGGHYPGGLYTVLYRGKGTLQFRGGAAKVVSQQPGRMTVQVDPGAGEFGLNLAATDPKDPVREIHVLMPGHEEDYRKQPWNPKFLQRWRGMACLRFMDMAETNNSPISTWNERPTPEDATFMGRGVPIELLVDLANRLGADAWFCIPHRADDDYVRNFARLVRDRLDPKHKAYVEYSNEVWNGVFHQTRYVREQGQKLGFGDKPWEAGWRYTARRSVQIFALWEEVFGGHDRFVRVLAGQAGGANVSKQVVSFEDAYKHADVLAIAPYIPMGIFGDDARKGAPKTRLFASDVARWSVDQVFRHLEERALPETLQDIRANKKVADQYGLKLVAYEGGQHMVGIQGAENVDALTKLLQAVNADPRMEALYVKYFAMWQREGGDLFCHYASTGQWSKWGCWSLVQYLDEDPLRSPKYRAVARWARSLGQPLGGSRGGSPADSARRPRNGAR
jgi:hypothetical protein